MPTPFAASPLPATLATFPAVRLPALARTVRLPVPGHPDMASTRPVPETVNPQIADSGWRPWSLHAHWRRLHHDNATVLVPATTAPMPWIRCHHTAGQPAAEHQQRQGQHTSHRKCHLACGHGGRSAQRRRSGRTDPYNVPAPNRADAPPVPHGIQRANWRCMKAQISAAASGPVGSLNGKDFAPPLHAWPMPVTRDRLTTTRRPTR